MASQGRWAGRKNGGAFVPKNELSPEQQMLLAAVPQWKREWVRPAGLKPNQSPTYKVCKWVLDTNAGAEEGTEEEMEAALQVVAQQAPLNAPSEAPPSALASGAPSGAVTPVPPTQESNVEATMQGVEGVLAATNESLKPAEGQAEQPREEVPPPVAEAAKVDVVMDSIEPENAAAVVVAEDQLGVTFEE